MPVTAGKTAAQLEWMGIIEKDINLSIAQNLRDLLVMNGYTVVMTRDSDTAIYDPGMETLREKKVSDLENRLELMKEYPGSIFISIHQNQFGSPIYSGTQVFYSPNSQTSQELAQIIQEHAKADLDEENNRTIKEVGDEDLSALECADNGCHGGMRVPFHTRTRPTNWWMQTTRSGWPL